MGRQVRVALVVQWILWLLIAAALICSSRAGENASSSADHLKPEFSPSPDSLREVAAPPTTVRAVPPSLQPTIPTIQPPAPAIQGSTGWPKSIPPSVPEHWDGPTASTQRPKLAPSTPKSPSEPDFHANAPKANPQITTHAPEHSLSPHKAPSPLRMTPSGQGHLPILSPHSHPTKPKPPPPEPVWVLPPPPPNLDCNWLQCSEPLTNPVPGSPCVCVLPIKVALSLSVTLYAFFPSVSKFAHDISSGMDMKLSQVRIMGANVAAQQPEKATVLVDLVPLGEKFDNSSAFLAYEKFWHKEINVDSSLFGNYDVLYVIYPGLPSSPPVAPVSISSFGNSNNPRTIKPLGVDVPRPKRNVSHSTVALVVLAFFMALAVCIGGVCMLLLMLSDRRNPPVATPHRLLPIFGKSSGTNKISSSSAPFSSGFAIYSGSTKTFTLDEIERATESFDDSRIIGEGGFGRVYEGILEDGTKVAVKILKREDQQGVNEFLAEVEMLNRLHHRNLVKLIGTCIEENVRCVVYELIPNGSVESHLHGVHKRTSPLDWNARMKIALGAARGLAYLHEDSSPPVIHRDFKSSNILLEEDFTPKVSDFGLARSALNEGNGHISTRVMGTFGYVAPEYAMTGHLLVKSDVYSYGVVLLELLTGRKPVEMSQPPGQENLVTWARPLLASIDGLKTVIDPALSAIVPFEKVAKVAAIASLCVQPEASYRPLMGEVVQTLKLVCNECEGSREADNWSHGELSSHEKAIRIAAWSAFEANRELWATDVLGMSEPRNDSGLFLWRSSSGPQRSGKGRQFWQRLRSSSTGGIDDHGIAVKMRMNVEGGEGWP